MSARTGRQLAVTAEIGGKMACRKCAACCLASFGSIHIAKQAGGEGGVPGWILFETVLGIEFF